MSNKIEEIYIWCCDKDLSSGEGQLANLFIKDLAKRNKIIYINKKIFKDKDSIWHKYLLPLIGIYYCWKKFLEKKEVCFLNYLPLWNCILFLFLPPKTIFGPITGGAISGSGYQKLIRSIIFPILYKISQIILFFRKQKLLFATNLLKNNCYQFILKKSFWNYQLKKINLEKKTSKKNIDLLIYYRKHLNKERMLIDKVLLNTCSYKKILIVGDWLNNSKVKNLGYKNNKIVQNILKRTKYSIVSSENLFSFYTMECINNNVLLIYEKKPTMQIKILKKYFVDIKRFNYTNNLKINQNYINKQNDFLKKINNKTKLFFH